VIVKADGARPAAPRLGGKAVALLVYLAMERGTHSRSAVASLLWSEHTDDHARTSLRQVLAQIRRAVGPVLREGGSGLALEADVVRDIDPLLDDSDTGGTELDVGHFLTELQVSGAPAFEEWAAITREKLRARAAGRLATAVAQLLARHDTVAALAAAERWSALVPLDDAPAIAAAHVFEQSGRPAEGLARLDAHGRRVQQEIGRAPGAALTTLAHRLRKLAVRETDWAAARDLAPSASVRHNGASDEAGEAARRIARLLGEAPLQERESEWHVLADAWKAARDGAGAVVLIEGEHGVGTSRLLRDLGRWVAGTGGTVIQTTGLAADRSVPFGVLARLVHSAIDADGAGGTDGHWLAELARLEPAVHARFPGAPPAPASSAVDGWRIFEALAQLLIVLVADGPVLVLLDDLPWCDEETAGLLQALIERTRNMPVLWCAAASVGVAGRDSAGVRLSRTLSGTLRARMVRPRRLGPGGVRGIIDALGNLHDGPRATSRASALVERVLAESEGLPLFAVALLRELYAAGTFTVTAGTWDAKLAVSDPLPVRLADVGAVRWPIGARVERLAEDEHQVLMTIALADRACDVELLSLVNGISRLRAAVLCNSLRANGLLAEDGNAFRCSPRLVADVMRAEVGSVMRIETERAIASVLDARTGAGPSMLATAVAGAEASVS
jgi:DNA-binding SARP family transcriptional activator